MQHQPVLCAEAVQALFPRPGRVYVDATLGGGGHAAALCRELGEDNVLIGVDQDLVALAQAEQVLQDVRPRVLLLEGNFGRLAMLLSQAGISRVDGGMLLDLGVSDFQIKTPERGFSFQHAGPLDMRMATGFSQSAADIVNQWDETALADLFYQNADERLARPIARAIVQARPFHETQALASVIQRVYRAKGNRPRQIHPATRVFQALRMAVNDEVAMLTTCLAALPTILAPGARMAVITFHSIEDRLVKQAFRQASATCLCPPRQPRCTCGHQPTLQVLGKPIRPTPEEIQRNPQARSAKLRVAQRL